jgi:hypothetical protein
MAIQNYSDGNKQMELMSQNLQALGTYVSSLVDALSIGTSAQYELSEPMCVGGAAGTYTLRSTFVGECQWKVDSAFAGSSQSQVYISTRQQKTGLDLTGAVQSTSELTPYDGMVLNLIPNQSIPITSEWYDLRGSSHSTLYILIVASTNAAFVNIVFRQKRGT